MGVLYPTTPATCLSLHLPPFDTDSLPARHDGEGLTLGAIKHSRRNYEMFQYGAGVQKE